MIGFVSQTIRCWSELKPTPTLARLPVNPCFWYISITVAGDWVIRYILASHCSDNNTINVTLDLVGITRATTVGLSGFGQCLPPRNQQTYLNVREGKEGSQTCFSRRPYIYQLFRDKDSEHITLSDAPPLSRPSLKIPGMPRPRRQALHARLSHQQQ
jgi:hypothetical protein